MKKQRDDWLPEEPYATVVGKGWDALAHYVNEEGCLKEVCIGTGHGDGSIQHYLNRPRETGDPHGQAALLWAIPAITQLLGRQ